MPRYRQSYGKIFDVQVRGIQQATSNLKKLDQKIRRSIVSKGVRAGSKPIREAAKRLAPVDSGNMRRSIRTSVRWLRGKGSVLGVTKPKSTKGQKKKGIDAWYAHILIGGAKPHNLNNRNSGHWTARPKPDWADHPYSSINHPGIKGNNWMWRAARQSFAKAVKAFRAKYGPEVENATKALPK